MLAFSQGGSLAVNPPPETPLSLPSFNGWLKKLCATATCQITKAQTLVPTHVRHVLPDAKAYLISKSGQRFYLLHDLTLWQGQLNLQELTFLPYHVSDRWTPTRLNMVGGWLTNLAGGQLNVGTMWQCVERLKQSSSTHRLFDIGDGSPPLNVLALSPEEAALGGCYWMAGKRNIAFGFTGKGRF